MLIRRSLFISIVIIFVFKCINSSWKGFGRINALSIGDLPSDFSADFKDLVGWAKKSEFHMFVVPPATSAFSSFRYLTKKSVWGTVNDINQLAYSPDYYLRAYERLQGLGLVILEPHKFEFNYTPCSLLQNKSLHGIPIIFSRSGNLDCLKEYEELFRNKSYIVTRYI